MITVSIITFFILIISFHSYGQSINDDTKIYNFKKYDIVDGDIDSIKLVLESIYKNDYYDAPDEAIKRAVDVAFEGFMIFFGFDEENKIIAESKLDTFWIKTIEKASIFSGVNQFIKDSSNYTKYSKDKKRILYKGPLKDKECITLVDKNIESTELIRKKKLKIKCSEDDFEFGDLIIEIEYTEEDNFPINYLFELKQSILGKVIRIASYYELVPQVKTVISPID